LSWLKYDKRHNPFTQLNYPTHQGARQPLWGRFVPFHYGGKLMNRSEIEMMAEPLEVDITPKPIRIELPAQLREYADAADNCPWPLREMLRQAATEIERLQRMVKSNDPAALLREIWKHHQPVYLFETIPDHIDPQEAS
jgi:hypothetical protein